jgi:hypothetical protein
LGKLRFVSDDVPDDAIFGAVLMLMCPVQESAALTPVLQVFPGMSTLLQQR